MAEFSFERELDRLFSEGPAFPDAPLFALKVEEKLDRGWTARQLVIGGFGLLGGLIGGAQLMGSGVTRQLQQIPEVTHRILSVRLDDILPADMLPADVPVSIEALALSALFAVAAVAFAITRAIREF